MKPFWRYFGAKYRSAPRYPGPRFPTIIEPFAGAAGYSLRYSKRNVILVEKYPIVAGIWRYLISVSSSEIEAIPLVEHVDDLPGWVPQEARHLVGFCMNSACISPRKRLSIGRKRLAALGRKYEGWTEAQRERVANQVGSIRHWKIVEGDYTQAPNIAATWFIDPPYQKMGKHYVHHTVDYGRLAAWCKERQGQKIVCEAEGADWLPFQPFATVKSNPYSKTSAELIWSV